MPVNSAVYLVNLETNSGQYTDVASLVTRFHISRQIASLFQPLQEGRLTVELDNNASNFTPSNSASPHYPNLVPGKNIRVQATSAGSTYDLFFGKVLEYSLQPGIGRRTVMLEAADAAQRLRETTINTSLFVGVNTASLFTALMSASNVASFAADVFYDSIPFAWFQDVIAAGAIQKIVEFGNYSVYVDPAGTIKLKNRYFGLDAVSVASYMASNTDGFFSMDYTLNADSIINLSKVSGQTRQAATSQQTVAWLSEKPTIAASACLGFWVSYVNPAEPTVGCPAMSLQVPVSSSDWKLNTAADGSGVDRTSTGSLSITLFGEAAVCSLCNGSADTVYVTKFQIRGFSVPQQPSLAVQHDNTSSQLDYGKREFTLENDFIGTQNYAKDYAKFLVDNHKNPIADITMALNNVFPDAVAHDLGDILSLVESHSGVNSQWSITSLDHDVTFDEGIQHVTTFGVKFYNNKPWLILDDPIRGVLDGNRELAF